MEILPDALTRQARPDIATGKLQRQRRLTRSEVDNLVDLYATGITFANLQRPSGSTATQSDDTSNVEVSRAERQYASSPMSFSQRSYVGIWQANR